MSIPLSPISSHIVIKPNDRQQGVVLVVALVLLLIMTSVGVTTMVSTTLQERMAGNSRQQLVARMNAEAALRRGEDYLDSLSVGILLQRDFESAFLTNSWLYISQQLENSGFGVKAVPSSFELTDPDDWTNDSSFELTDLTVSSAGALNPRYIIEYLGKQNTGLQVVSKENNKMITAEPFVFRITAIGWGEDRNAVSVLQSYYFSRTQ
ncbi:hypothetical protein AB835_01025 [Candidatus Endobugula sertula]|uniref:Type 4 fimbrial biogenesis protein PilX N-terminal domain-containing protein n=1 Tax=Candidatus Endobugula sertula TaxID=62101 RepID=A0A1D2QTH0_9GAMM|nr:hypothetical protein AB835_01025 [Candidatus Endobugula sertula]